MGILKDIFHNFQENRRAALEEMRIREDSIRTIWNSYTVPKIIEHAKEVLGPQERLGPIEDWGSTSHISLRKPFLCHSLGLHYVTREIPRHEDRYRDVTASSHVFSIGLSEAGFYVARSYYGPSFLGTTQTIPGFEALLARVDPYISKK